MSKFYPFGKGKSVVQDFFLSFFGGKGKPMFMTDIVKEAFKGGENCRSV